MSCDPRYRFDLTNRFVIDATPQEMTRIVLDPDVFAKWAPRVIVKMQLLDRGGPDGTGIENRIHASGWLPYGIVFTVRIAQVVPDRSMHMTLRGDFHGDAYLSIRPLPDGRGCEETIRAVFEMRHRYLRPLVPTLRPLFVWNHRWAVRWLHRAMQREVYRRRHLADGFPDQRPTFPHNLPWFRNRWPKRAAADDALPNASDR